MKFIADVMLGRLAKRMRLLGFDVLYERTLNDNEIIRLSLEQDRVILTRDTALAERPLASNHVFISHDALQEQVRQILVACSRERMPPPLTRCSLCNEPLQEISRRDAKYLVPAYVYETHDRFLHCAACGRMYWIGTHVQKMGLPDTKKQKGPAS